MLFRFRKKKTGTPGSDEIRWGRSFAVTALMVGIIFLVSVLVMHSINSMERRSSFERLYAEARGIASFIETTIANDREQLKLLAGVVARYDDLRDPALRELLASYDNIGMMSRVDMLLPDDRVLTQDGQCLDASGRISFEEQAALGAHVSDRVTDLLRPDVYVLYNYVPVLRGGRTVALLMGVVIIEELPLKVQALPYGGRGDLYVMDGHTGDFIVDTWHKGKVGNLWDLGHRKMAPGYDGTMLKQGVVEGKSAHVIFVSKTIGEYLYFYFEPMRVNAWRIAVSVPESVVFESAAIIERRLNLFLAFEFVCFALYLWWMGRMVRSVTSEKQRRLEAIQHLNEIEQLLFNAHHETDNVFAALQKLSAIIGSECTALWIMGLNGCRRRFILKDGQSLTEPLTQETDPVFDYLSAHFAGDNPVYEAHSSEELKRDFAGAIPGSISSMLAVPVKDSATGQLSGILMLCNLKRDSVQKALLKALSFSFALFCSNLNNRLLLEEQGDRDVLTGLYNRNRYERDLLVLEKSAGNGLTCIYIDVNGLHEMNNTQGHDAGDRMLRAVAAAIRSAFDAPYRYRTGGDEFVLFMEGEDEALTERVAHSLSLELERQGYHVSVGLKSGRYPGALSALIKESEKRMYAAKQRFYAEKNRAPRVSRSHPG